MNKNTAVMRKYFFSIVFTLAVGASDAGSGSSHVHSVRNWCFSGSYHVHEKPGRQSTGQEVQEAAGLHLSH